jgi:hypothetical protein
MERCEGKLSCVACPSCWQVFHPKISRLDLRNADDQTRHLSVTPDMCLDELPERPLHEPKDNELDDVLDKEGEFHET